MPSLVGLHDPTATREELRAARDEMMAAVDLPAFGFSKVAAASEHVACGNVLPGMEDNLSQPVHDRARGLWLMLDGELLSVRELRAELAARGVDTMGRDDAGLALAAYVVFGADFVDRLNGCWNIVLHDEAARATFVITDRLGSRQLFVAEDGPRFVFANEMKGVIAGRKVATRPGGVGLVSLLSSGGHHGGHTWLQGIRLLSAGTIVRLEESRRTERRYFKLRFNEGGPQMSESSYAQGFAERLRVATERNMKLSDRQPIAITLSGGLDSRAVALAIAPAHRPLSAITYGNEESADVRYAKQLAEVIGLNHVYVEPEYERLVADSSKVYARLTGRTGEQGFYSAQLDRIIWRSEGLTMFDGLASAIWHPLYRQHMAFMLNGAAGDAMTGSHLTPDLMLSPTRDALISSFIRRRLFQPDALLAKVLRPAIYDQTRDEVRAAFAADFDDIDADDPLAIANIWDMENRQRRGAFTSFTMERYFCTCRSPFLDYDLVDFLCQVPGRWRFQQRIYKRMLVEAFPEAAHVPWAYTEGRITTSPSFEFAREAYNFAWARAKKVLPWEKNKPDRWLFRDAVTMLRQDRVLVKMLEDSTRADWFPSDVFDPAAVRALTDEFVRTGDGNHYALFTHLVGICRAIELMLVPSHIRVPRTADPAEFGVSTASLVAP